jgi:hypothetical protein
MSKPLKPGQIDVSKIAHDKLKLKKYKNGQESKQVRMTYDKKEFRIQTPLAKVPFGLTTGEELDNEGKPVKNSIKPKKYSLDLQFDAGTKLGEFKEAMKNVDNLNIQHILGQSKEWWGKQFTKDAVEDVCYGSLIKADKKGEYPDRFKIKLPFYDGAPRFKVYNNRNEEIQWCTLEEGKPPVLDWSWAQPYMQVEAIVECEGLWEVNKKVFCTFKAIQLRITPPEGLPDCAFVDDAAPASESMPKQDDVKVEDDDDEEEDDEEEEEE